MPATDGSRAAGDRASLTLGTLALPGLGSGDSQLLVDTALDSGILAFDTADAYGDGVAEQLLGRALGARRDQVFISTKVGILRDGSTLTGRAVRERVEASLRRLGTDHVEVCHLHMPDPRADGDEILTALDALQRDGLILASGWSNFPAEMIALEAAAAAAAGISRPAWLQVQYSALERTAEASTFPLAERLQLQVQVWGPLSSGWLTGMAADSGSANVDPTRANRRPFSFDPALPGNRAKAEFVKELATLARQRAIPISQLALAFAMTHPAVTSVIVGPRTADELIDCASARELELDGSVLDAIDRLVAPGTAVNPDDFAWRHPALLDPVLRRRAPKNY